MQEIPQNRRNRGCVFVWSTIFYNNK